MIFLNGVLSEWSLPGCRCQLDQRCPEPAPGLRIHETLSWSDLTVGSGMPTRPGGRDATLFTVASCSRPAAGKDERGAAKARLVRALLDRCGWTAARAENFLPATGSCYKNCRAANPELSAVYGKGEEEETGLSLQGGGTGIAVSCPEPHSDEATGGTVGIRIPRCAPQGHGGFSDKIRLTADSMGRPILLVGERRGPAVSFSHVGLMTWAVFAAEGCTVGIDAASRNEFTGQYPFHRAFQDDELDAVPEEAAGEVADAAAAVWSVKEAAVKGLGCGFWMVDPLDVHVDRWTRAGHGFVSEVVLPKQVRKPFAHAQALPVWTFSDNGVWVSATVLDSSLI